LESNLKKYPKFIKEIGIKTACYWAYRKDDHDLKFTFSYIKRGLTAKKRKLPDFLIVGAAKSGTTSLYEYLIQHDQVLPALRKEINYWNQYKKFGLNWYRGNFPLQNESKNKITGEASVSYLRFPELAFEIKKDVPDIKIIIILRNPVDRAFSDYNYQLNHNKIETLSFEEALAQESQRPPGNLQYKIQSTYIDLIKPYFQSFPKENILVIDFNDLIKSPKEVMDKTCAFLQISKKNNWIFKPFNKLEYSTNLKSETKNQLKVFFKPYNEKLFNFLKRRFDWD
jgi:hypothetical protein